MSAETLQLAPSVQASYTEIVDCILKRISSLLSLQIKYNQNRPSVKPSTSTKQSKIQAESYGGGGGKLDGKPWQWQSA